MSAGYPRTLTGKPLSWLILAFMLVSQSGYAAFCSLRDPVGAINQLYPEADQHRSIVRPVNQQARERVASQLPFTLHFNEIGQHTLYVAVKNNSPLGFVHARSELADWGLIELAWSIDLDLTVNGFYFQRCRSPACNSDLAAELSTKLNGLNLNQLRMLINDNGDQLGIDLASQFEDNQDLVLAIVRSALKTLAITEIAWSDDIGEIHRQQLLSRHFGDTSDLQLLPVFDSDIQLQQQAEQSGINDAIIHLEATDVVLVIENGKELGRLVDARWSDGENSDQFSWLFSSQGQVLDIQSGKQWPNQEMSVSFDDVIGTQFSDVMNCSTAAEVVGKSLFTTGFSNAP